MADNLIRIGIEIVNPSKNLQSLDWSRLGDFFGYSKLL